MTLCHANARPSLVGCVHAHFPKSVQPLHMLVVTMLAEDGCMQQVCNNCLGGSCLQKQCFVFVFCQGLVSEDVTPSVFHTILFTIAATAFSRQDNNWDIMSPSLGHHDTIPGLIGRETLHVTACVPKHLMQPCKWCKTADATVVLTHDSTECKFLKQITAKSWS